MTPVAVENFQVLKEAQTTERFQEMAADNPLRGRVNLLSWDGKGLPEGIFPSSREDDK